MLHLDERVSRVMGIEWRRLARTAEVCVGADCTLVTNATNASATTGPGTLRTVAVDAVVHDTHRVANAVQGLNIAGAKDGEEAVSGVGGVGEGHAIAAEVEIRAIYAFMADTKDALVAIVASSVMTDIASRLQHLLLNRRKLETLSGKKLMTRIMTTLGRAEACNAKIVIGTGLARNGLCFLDSNDARVAVVAVNNKSKMSAGHRRQLSSGVVDGRRLSWNLNLNRNRSSRSGPWWRGNLDNLGTNSLVEPLGELWALEVV